MEKVRILQFLKEALDDHQKIRTHHADICDLCKNFLKFIHEIEGEIYE